MRHDELVALIERGVAASGGTWADFGAGGGNFTRALHDLVGADATIYAVDHDNRVLSRQQRGIQTITADFTQPIPSLPPLDGLLVANALHFVRNQRQAMQRLAGYLQHGGTFLIVEYDVRFPRGYIPNPLPYSKFEPLALEIGLGDIERVGSRTSPTSGVTMYAARAVVNQQ